MASEKSCQSSPLCANGCGFFGNTVMLNLCSKCYKDYCHSEELKQAAAPKASASNEKVKASDVCESSSLEGSALAGLASEDGWSVAKIDRCSRCNKKVGLLKGFKCRCGSVYCMVHRYPEEHACMFDFKAAARAAIAKANPVIKADKLRRRV